MLNSKNIKETTILKVTFKIAIAILKTMIIILKILHDSCKNKITIKIKTLRCDALQELQISTRGTEIIIIKVDPNGNHSCNSTIGSRKMYLSSGWRVDLACGN